MPQVGRLTKLFAGLRGAELCFGEPVELDGRQIIPVASVQIVGGYGFGRGTEEAATGGDRDADDAGAGKTGEGGGGGGNIIVRPVGYVESTAAGTRFKRIFDPAALLGVPVLLALGKAIASWRRVRG